MLLAEKKIDNRYFRSEYIKMYCSTSRDVKIYGR